MFGAGKVDETSPRGRGPIVPTDVFEMSLNCVEKYRPLLFTTNDNKEVKRASHVDRIDRCS